jgi:hypothetical protein
MAEGRYADALAAYIWFHDHALEHMSVLYGVRLSYGLFEWVDLGAVYPPAMLALRDIRDRKAASLRSGDGNRSLFDDVSSINERLGEEVQTAHLFRHLHASWPDLASQCVTYALPALIVAGDFLLARQIMPEPEHNVRRQARDLNRLVAEIKHDKLCLAPKRWAYISNFAENVRNILLILRRCGELAEANRIEMLALNLIQSPSVRRDASASFIKQSNAPAIRRRAKWKLRDK